MAQRSLLPAIEVALAQSQRMRQARRQAEVTQQKMQEERRIRKAQQYLARGGRVLVAAQAGQADEGSAYREKVVGQWVLPQREPAVFHAIRLMAPVRDLKAITREDRVARQNAVPIRGEGGRCIGVLIRERDISRDLLQEKKFQSLARSYEQEDLSLRSPQPLRDDAALREIHHRVKNNLQLVASILNLQARRAPDSACRRLLGESDHRLPLRGRAVPHRHRIG